MTTHTFIEILRRAIDEEMSLDAAVHLLGEDVAAGGAFGRCRPGPPRGPQRCLAALRYSLAGAEMSRMMTGESRTMTL